MVFFKTYSQKIIKHDLINVFAYPNLNELPELKKIILNFGYQKSNLKHIISGLLALEFLSSWKGGITKSKHLNLFLKIKKGNPVGCKIVLKKNIMFFFYLKLTTSILPKIKQYKVFQHEGDLNNFKSISFQFLNNII